MTPMPSLAQPVDPRSELRALALAALGVQLVLLLGMDAALLAGVAPHPPAERGPFIAAAMAACTGALLQFALHARSARWWGLAAALVVWPGVGLHKFATEPNAVLLAPVIVIGSATALLLAWASWRHRPAG